MKQRVFVLLISFAMIITACSCEISKVQKKSLYNLYTGEGFEGTVEECLNSMDDRMIPIVRTAYIDDVNEGYKGSLIEWTADKNNAFINEEGEVVIILKSKAEVNIGKASEFINKTKNNKNYDGIIEVSHTKAQRGEQDVEIEVVLKDNPGILGMALALSYDDKALKLVSVENGEALNKTLTFTKPKCFSSGSVFVWDGVELKQKDIKNGCIMKLVFDVGDNAKTGQYSISITAVENSIIDNNLDDLEMKIIDGSLNVE